MKRASRAGGAWAGRALTAAAVLVAALAAIGGCGGPANVGALQRELADEKAKREQAQGRVDQLDAMLADYSELQRRLKELEARGAPIEWRHPIPDAEVDRGRLILGDLTFRPGEHKLSARGEKALDRVAETLTGGDRAMARLAIEGHSDTTPLRRTKDKYESNWHLSVMRAIAVQEYLEGKGVKKGQTYVVGYGPLMPRGGPRNKDRRVELRGYWKPTE